MSDKTTQMKMCELRAQGLMKEMDERSTNPTVVCGKCRVKANNPEDLHNPRPLNKKTSDNYWS